MRVRKTNGSGKIGAAAFAVFLALTVFGVKPVFSAELAVQEISDKASGAVGDLSQLIGPDEYIGIAVGTYRSAGGITPEMMIRYYDSSGILRGETVGHIGEYMGMFNMGNFCVITEGELLSEKENDDIVLLRMEDFREVCRYSRDELRAGRVASAGDHVAILSRDGSHLEIYDKDGQIAADLQTDGAPAFHSDTGMTDWVDLEMYELEGYLYVRLRKGEERILTALIHEDGSVLTSKDASFPEILCREQVCGFIGKNLIMKQDPDGMSGQGQYMILSPEGEVLYRDVVIRWTTNGTWYKSQTQKADFAALREEDTLLILDETLAEAGRISDADLDGEGNLQYAGGTIIGLPCEELGGECSTDVLTYLREDVPAVKVSGGYRITEELGGFIPEPEEGWELESFSDSFLLLMDADYQRRVVRRADGKVLFEGRRMIFLQNTSFAVELDISDYKNTVTVIYSEEGEELYSAQSWIPPCLDEWYYAYRGPWAGIIDPEGNWILRELQYDE